MGLSYTYINKYKKNTYKEILVTQFPLRVRDLPISRLINWSYSEQKDVCQGLKNVSHAFSFPNSCITAITTLPRAPRWMCIQFTYHLQGMMLLLSTVCFTLLCKSKCSKPQSKLASKNLFWSSNIKSEAFAAGIICIFVGFTQTCCIPA